MPSNDDDDYTTKLSPVSLNSGSRITDGELFPEALSELTYRERMGFYENLLPDAYEDALHEWCGEGRSPKVFLALHSYLREGLSEAEIKELLGVSESSITPQAVEEFEELVADT